jgi:hypothetical protein
MYVVAYAVELTGIAIIADAFLVKRNGKKKMGYYLPITQYSSSPIF